MKSLLTKQAGMISTTLATGGGVLFGLLALGGLGGSLSVGSKLWPQPPMNEEEAKQQILSSFLYQIKSALDQSSFDTFAEEQLGIASMLFRN